MITRVIVIAIIVLSVNAIWHGWTIQIGEDNPNSKVLLRVKANPLKNLFTKKGGL